MIIFYKQALQLNLNFTHACQYTRVSVCSLHVKLKMACIHTVGHNYGMRTIASEHMQHTSDARHDLALDVPCYMCGA